MSLCPVSHRARSKGYLKVVNDEHYHIKGKFMLAFVIFWAYIASACMLIWYANIPEENIYFRIRNTERGGISVSFGDRAILPAVSGAALQATKRAI
jgi:hypothetical protein